MAENVVAGLRGESISVRSILSNDTNEILRTIPHAQAVICDRASENVIAQLPPKIQTCVYSLYSDHTIEAMKQRLEQWG